MDKFKKLFNISNYIKLLQYAYGYKKQILLLTFFSIFVSLIGIAEALVTQRLVDYAVDSQIQLAIRFGVFFVVLLVLELLMHSLIPYYRLNVIEPFRNKLQLKIIRSLYKKKLLQLYHYKTGDILTRVYNDVDNIISVLCSTIPNLIGLVLRLFLAFFILFSYDALLATLTFLITPITILFSMMIGRKLKKIQLDIQHADAMQRSLITESIQNIVILKTYNYLNQNLENIENTQNIRFGFMKSKTKISIRANLLLGIGYRFGFFGALGLGAFRLTTKAISFGTFTAFLQLINQIQGPIQALAISLPQLISTMSSVERIEALEYLDDESVIAIGESSSKKPTSIQINNLHFRYNQDIPVLTGINLKIDQGDKVGIVGLSGEGKTTIIHLLLSLIEPDQGNIEIEYADGSCKKVSANTRQYFSYVPQENSLFSGTIRSNFLLADDVSEEDIEKALVASCSKTFIDSLPHGIDSLISERGIGLSQGQAQRLTIARALLHNTPFLILDEASSALDHETEKQLIQNLKTSYPDMSIIVITHKKAMLNMCRHIYKLSNGQLHEISLESMN